MADTPDDDDDETTEQPLSERFLDLFVFLPTGLAVTVAEELPRLAERGRERLGVQVNSARAVGKFAVHRRAPGAEAAVGRSGPTTATPSSTRPPARRPERSPGPGRPDGPTPPADDPVPAGAPAAVAVTGRTAGDPDDGRGHRASAGPAPARPPVDAHVPDVARWPSPASTRCPPPRSSSGSTG